MSDRIWIGSAEGSSTRGKVLPAWSGNRSRPHVRTMSTLVAVVAAAVVTGAVGGLI